MPVKTRAEYFAASPFSSVADINAASFWAGRPNVLNRLSKLCRAFARRSDSSIDVIWANLGAGKSHALLHLAHMLANPWNEEVPTVIAYIEIPQNLTSFLDLYRQIVNAVPAIELETCLSGVQDASISENLRRAGNMFEHGGSSEKALVREWLLGGRPYLRELKTVAGIDTRIEDDTVASTILNNFVHLCAQQKKRFVLLVDEYQRIATIPTRKRDSILSSVRTIFSHNASYLSMVVAVGSRAEKTALELIPSELRTLMSMRPVISLPEMSISEAEEYITERLRFFRPADYTGPLLAPFTPELVRTVLEFIAANTTASMIPRVIHKVLASIYDELLDSPDEELTGESLKRCLAELNWDHIST